MQIHWAFPFPPASFNPFMTNPTATHKSYWKLGPQDTPPFPCLIRWCTEHLVLLPTDSIRGEQYILNFLDLVHFDVRFSLLCKQDFNYECLVFPPFSRFIFPKSCFKQFNCKSRYSCHVEFQVKEKCLTSNTLGLSGICKHYLTYGAEICTVGKIKHFSFFLEYHFLILVCHHQRI